MLALLSADWCLVSDLMMHKTKKSACSEWCTENANERCILTKEMGGLKQKVNGDVVEPIMKDEKLMSVKTNFCKNHLTF